MQNSQLESLMRTTGGITNEPIPDERDFLSDSTDQDSEISTDYDDGQEECVQPPNEEQVTDEEFNSDQFTRPINIYKWCKTAYQQFNEYLKNPTDAPWNETANILTSEEQNHVIITDYETVYNYIDESEWSDGYVLIYPFVNDDYEMFTIAECVKVYVYDDALPQFKEFLKHYELVSKQCGYITNKFVVCKVRTR